MNAQKFTQKSLEAVKAAQDLAIEYQNMQIEEEHLLYALVAQENGLIPQLLQKMGIDPTGLRQSLLDAIGRMNKVTGPGREADKIYVSPQVDRVLNDAEKQAAHMKDEYVSVEHLMLALLDQPSEGVKSLLRAFGVEKNRFLEALASVRGSARVTTDSPESTYDALAKYGQDLVALAKAQKLDPV
ncbi:MAG TPA: type VI secretion system ATPase TssH, partial [Firmicutes bacterium]|nr:type VI secretion system ATPase TssH [Bacillota bacterium]